MENQPVVSISRVRRNCQVKCYFSLKDCSVLLPSAARVCGQRFCGRLVILSSHAARYVFASRYGAHACFSASHRAVPLDQQLGDRAGFSTSPYIIQHWHNVHRRATLMKRDRAWSRTLAQVTMFSALRDLGAVGTRANNSSRSQWRCQLIKCWTFCSTALEVNLLHYFFSIYVYLILLII